MRRAPARPSLRVGIVTLAPEMFASVLATGLIGRAIRAGLLEATFANPRDYARDAHRRVDARPYGGGPGMVLMPGPLDAAIRQVAKRGSWIVGLSPRGRPFGAPTASRLAKKKQIVLVCGRYEGLDERVCASFDEEISIGDYVLSGGEVAAMAVLDAVARLVPGAMGNASSFAEESFADGLLEYPQYTRPRVWRGKRVPAVLLSGNHARIGDWRRRKSLELTRRLRPDLLLARKSSKV